MRIQFVYIIPLAIAAFSASDVRGDEASSSTSAPRPVPLTRPEMKQYLENMKGRTPRIPLPELTDEEKASAAADGRSSSYEGRLRSVYMPADARGNYFAGLGGRSSTGATPGNAAPGNATPGNAAANPGARPSGSGFRGNEDPKMTLDYRFKTSLFWIVSRTNNCQYCLGHQESKLLGAGMLEDEIASLDGDWSDFGPAEQAAFAYARKITFEPHRLGDADLERLRKHYTDLQILEMTLSIAGNNSINRWKEGVGVPQSSNGGGFGRRGEGEIAQATPEHSYLTPTSEKFQTKVSLVAPIAFESGKPTRQPVSSRPDLASPGELQDKLGAAKRRTPRLPLVDEATAREVLGEESPQGKLPQWMLLLANFPVTGKRTMGSVVSADEKGDLSPLLKAQVSWIIARQDQAWYALGQSQRRLAALGQSKDQIAALDGDWNEFSPRDKSLFTIARKLAASPVVLTDDDVAAAVKQAGPRDVVQLISYTTNRASFNRITEAAGLQIEP